MTDVARHRLVAVFGDVEAARGAVADLEGAGLAAGALRIDEPDRQGPEQAPGSGERDERFLRRATSAWVRGIALGVVIGAVAGLLGGLLAFGVRGQIATVGIIAFAVGGGAVGAGLGVLISGMLPHEQAPTRATSPAAGQPGETRLVVQVRSAEESRSARRVLDARGARVLDAGLDDA